MDLSAYHILLTRPTEQGKSLCSKLIEQNATVLHQPSLVIEPLPLSQEAFKLAKQPYDGIVVTSSNALHSDQLLKTLQQHHQDTPFYAIGPATASRLTTLGYQPHLPEQANSEGLLALPALRTVSQKKFLLLKGLAGRTLLAETLIQRGAQLTTLSVYQRSLPKLTLGSLVQQWQQAQINLVICSSHQGLIHLIELLTPAYHALLQECDLVVISERMAHQAKSLSIPVKSLIIADGASDESILAAICHHSRGRINHDSR